MLHAVIMAGGSGTRFWPVSRQGRPKQFLSLVGDRSLLRATFERLTGLIPAARTWVITTSASLEQARQQLPELPADQIVGEPVGRDTAACVGYAAHLLLHSDPDATCVVIPADHVIGEEDRFCSSLAAGAAVVEREGGLLTFGVQPTRPETGYGYLELGSAHCKSQGWTVHRLDRFVEKPNLETARSYVDSGRFLWNSGMFAWRAVELLAEIRRQLPRLADGLDELAAAIGSPSEASVTERIYPRLQRIAIDFGVMEGAERCWTVPVDYPWSDVGSWPSLRDVLPADSDHNVISGPIVAIEAKNNVLFSEGPVVGVVGLRDVVVVATGDAVLVTTMADAQRVREVVTSIGPTHK